MSVVEIVDAQVAAYRARDAAAFAACYAEDASVIAPDGTVMAAGRAAIEAMYGGLFSQSPDLTVEITNRIVSGSCVVDEEHVTGLIAEGMPSELRAAVLYRVSDDLITRADLLM